MARSGASEGIQKRHLAGTGGPKIAKQAGVAPRARPHSATPDVSLCNRHKLCCVPLGVVLVFRVEGDEADLSSGDEMLARANDSGRDFQSKSCMRRVGNTPRDAFRNGRRRGAAVHDLD